MYSQIYELLKGYLNILNEFQNTGPVPIFYPRVNNKKSKLERQLDIK
ncbi:MAG: hypothetical protein NTU63_02200 [Candidatus Pacearchaeota archaeon]|nr:hypothetical protein [Candidatus Pacearchaeota archaeon]